MLNFRSTTAAFLLILAIPYGSLFGQSTDPTSAKRWNERAFQSNYQPNLSDSEKAKGLAKLWAEVRFNFVHFDKVPELDWDAELARYMPKVLASESTLEYYRLLEELIAKLKDGHTNVYLPRELRQFNAVPQLKTAMIEDRVIVVEIADAKLTKQGIEIGQEVIAINGTPVKEYASANITPYVAASTPQDRQVKTYEKWLLRGPVNEKIRLKLRSAKGDPIIATISRVNVNPVWKYLQRKPPFSLKMLPDNIAYIQLNSFSSDAALKEFANAFERISKSDGLILDLRNNGGGNSGVGWEILGYLTDKPFLVPDWHMLQYRPTYRAWNRPAFAKLGKANATFKRIQKQHYQKKVMLLVGPRTFSAAEDMAAAFDVMGRGKIIGQATGGSTGQPLMFNLPGGGRARVCTKSDTYPNGTEFVGVGITPDVVVTPKVQDVIDHVDRTLQVALEEINQ